MYNYKVQLHTGETFLFSSDTPLSKLLEEVNSCTDSYMMFGAHIRQKVAVIGIDLISINGPTADTPTMEEEEGEL